MVAMMLGRLAQPIHGDGICKHVSGAVCTRPKNHESRYRPQLILHHRVSDVMCLCSLNRQGADSRHDLLSENV